MKTKLLFVLFAFALVSACSSGPAKEKRLKIGFAMDTLKEERWQRDYDAFKAHCEKLNVECVITIADNKADKQANDVDNLLTQKVDALVIAPHEAETVRHIFRRYLELGAVSALRDDLRQQGITSKFRTDKNGRSTGGKPFARGALRQEARPAYSPLGCDDQGPCGHRPRWPHRSPCARSP